MCLFFPRMLTFQMQSPICTWVYWNSTIMVCRWVLKSKFRKRSAYCFVYMRVCVCESDCTCLRCTSFHMEQILNSHKELSYSFEYLSHFIALFKWFCLNFVEKCVFLLNVVRIFNCIEMERVHIYRFCKRFVRIICWAFLFISVYSILFLLDNCNLTSSFGYLNGHLK